MVDEETMQHGIEEGYYDNIGRMLGLGCVLVCLCGYLARAYNWAEAGADLDGHLKEALA